MQSEQLDFEGKDPIDVESDSESQVDKDIDLDGPPPHRHPLSPIEDFSTTRLGLAGFGGL